MSEQMCPVCILADRCFNSAIKKDKSGMKQVPCQKCCSTSVPHLFMGRRLRLQDRRNFFPVLTPLVFTFTSCLLHDRGHRIFILTRRHLPSTQRVNEIC